MNNIKLIACDIDGVLLEDTFSPILYRLAKKYNKPYNQELECNTFSQNRKDAANYLRDYLGISNNRTEEEIIQEYFTERENFLKGKNSTVVEGVPEFINRLSRLGIPLICYGGLEESEIDYNFHRFLSCFQEYICTNHFRPGLREIISRYEMKESEVLFIDDVAKVAMEAKKYNIPFIGVPNHYQWGYQRSIMEEIGVKYIVNSISEITPDLLNELDQDTKVW